MSLTLDILLMSDPLSGHDRTNEWESQIDRDLTPKLKFPLKIREESFGDLDTSFGDPKIKEPAKKKTKVNKTPKVVDLGKKKSKDKTKLF